MSDSPVRPRDDEIWVPVTLHLPLGFAKSWTPNSCLPTAILCGPFTIIFLAQVRERGMRVAREREPVNTVARRCARLHAT